MKKYFLGLWIVLLLINVSFKLNAQFILDQIDGAQINRDLLFNNNSYKEVLGTPFLFDEWVKGSVWDNMNKKIDGITMKYFIYEDFLVIKKANNEEIKVKIPVNAFSFEYKGRTYFFKKIILNNKESFVEALSDGKIKLSLQRVKKLTLANTENNGYGKSGDNKNRFEDSEVLWLEIEGKSPMVLKRNKKSLVDIFPDKEAKITEFIKKEKINFKNNDDLIKLLKMLESQE